MIEIQIFSSLCVQDGMLNSFGGKNTKGTQFNFLPKNLSGETLCNFFLIFPPKVLVYIGQNF